MGTINHNEIGDDDQVFQDHLVYLWSLDRATRYKKSSYKFLKKFLDDRGHWKSLSRGLSGYYAKEHYRNTLGKLDNE